MLHISENSAWFDATGNVCVMHVAVSPVSTVFYPAPSFQAISQFNSTLSTIRREAEDLLQLAAVDFDSLPSFLAPVLSSVRRGELPCHWIPAQPGTPPQTLQEGVEGEPSYAIADPPPRAVSSTASKT